MSELEKLLAQVQSLVLQMEQVQVEATKAMLAIAAEIERRKQPAGPQPAGTRSR